MVKNKQCENEEKSKVKSKLQIVDFNQIYLRLRANNGA